MYILGSAEMLCEFYERQYYWFGHKNSSFLGGFGCSYLKFNMTNYGLNFFVMLADLSKYLGGFSIFIIVLQCQYVNLSLILSVLFGKFWLYWNKEHKCAGTVCLLCFIRSFASSKTVWSPQASWTYICNFFSQMSEKRH